MRILAVHSFYQQLGGEDLSFAAECDLLERNGHEVERFTLDNNVLSNMSALRAGMVTFWNPLVGRLVRDVIRRHRPDVMHCTNLFPTISPSCYWAAAREGVPIVQALRNYRLLCPAATLFRDGAPCERCISKRFAIDAIRFGCYRGSRAASAVTAASTLMHRAIGSWDRVHVFYTLTRFARQKFVEAGFAPERILVKPNFLEPDPGAGDGADGGVIFVGRLSPEKGLDTLLKAWGRISGNISLRIVGDGPLAGEVARAAASDPRIEWVGALPPAQTLELIRRARCLVMPSNWYETFGRTIMEAFACGTPVIASDLGAMAELVEHGRTGLLYTAGDPEALAATVQRFWDSPAQGSAMGVAARSLYLREFTGSANYTMLMALYERAIAVARHSAAIAAPEVVRRGKLA